MATEPLESTPEESAFGEISARLTAADLAYQDAVEMRNRYNYENPLKVLSIRIRLAELQEIVDKRASEVQALLEPYARLKEKRNGW